MPRVAASAFIAPTAVLVGDVVVGEESSVWFGAVLRADRGSIHIGARSSIEDNAVIHAGEDRMTAIGDDVTIGHCAVLDDCTVENNALIGSNAVVLDGARVGENTVVAAGSVVVVDERIAARSVVAGAPAKVHKALAGRAAEWIAHSATESLQQARCYRRDGFGDPLHHETKTTHRRKHAPPVVTSG
jgi:carbonic anhydrase/acetyltransferase-like protein (isoleucine patch superfamily)